MKILVVDDDVEVLRSLGNTFTTLLRGYLVLTAMTANQGLSLIKEQKPEIIVMDVRLGPISGMDLLEDYPRHMQDYHPRVVVITAYDDESAKKRAADLKVDAFLLKPFTKDVLLSTVFSSIENYYEGELKMVRLAKQAFQKKDAARQQTRDELNKKLKENGE